MSQGDQVKVKQRANASLQSNYATLTNRDQLSLGFMVMPVEKASPVRTRPGRGRAGHKRGESLQGHVVFSLEDLAIGKCFATAEGNCLQRTDPYRYRLWCPDDPSLAFEFGSEELQTATLHFDLGTIADVELDEPSHRPSAVLSSGEDDGDDDDDDDDDDHSGDDDDDKNSHSHHQSKTRRHHTSREGKKKHHRKVPSSTSSRAPFNASSRGPLSLPSLDAAAANAEVALLTDPLSLSVRGAVVRMASSGKRVSIHSQSELAIGAIYLTESGALRIVRKPDGLSITPVALLSSSSALTSPISSSLSPTISSSSLSTSSASSSSPSGRLSLLDTRGALSSLSSPAMALPVLPSDVPALTDLQSMLPPVPRATGAHPRREMRYSTIHQETGPTSMECAVESTDPNASHLCPVVVDVRVEDSFGEIVSLAASCLSIRWERSGSPQDDASFQFRCQSESRLYHPSLDDVDLFVRAVVEVRSAAARSSVSQPTTALRVCLDQDVRAEVEANLASRSAVFKLSCSDPRLPDPDCLLVLHSSSLALRSRHCPPFLFARLDDSVSCVLDPADPRRFFLQVPGHPLPFLFQAVSVFMRDVVVLTLKLLADLTQEATPTK
ncbi:MAG: hypothetical protein Q8P67_02720 [archaeon]|nr:hypothetical protein [archaeon]